MKVHIGPNLDKYVENPARHVLYEIADVTLPNPKTKDGPIIDYWFWVVGGYIKAYFRVWLVKFGSEVCGRGSMRSDWLPDRRPEPARYSPAHNSLIKSHVVGRHIILIWRNSEFCNLSSWFRAVCTIFGSIKHFWAFKVVWRLFVYTFTTLCSVQILFYFRNVRETYS